MLFLLRERGKDVIEQGVEDGVGVGAEFCLVAGEACGKVQR